MLAQAIFAGLLASLACGLGALPLAIPRLDPAKRRGIGYAFAGGLMLAASVYNLIGPAVYADGGSWTLSKIAPVIVGILVGAAFLSLADRFLGDHEPAPGNIPGVTPVSASGKCDRSGGDAHAAWGGRLGLLIFLAMTIHSIPEGVAVGVGYTADAADKSVGLGPSLALAIGIHNIPEGLAVAIPLRAAGVSITRCALAAIVTSLPQPLASGPAVLLAWFFQPLMPALMGFAAGAMIFLILQELIPEALETDRPRTIAWATTIGFCCMLLLQVFIGGAVGE
ncbi:MAG: ZIP family metal transporter [Planctomycetota bacterium]